MGTKPAHNESGNEETRQERREKKLRKARERIQQHGKSLGKIYEAGVKKREGK